MGLGLDLVPTPPRQRGRTEDDGLPHSFSVGSSGGLEAPTR